jgi:hypothetical protein
MIFIYEHGQKFIGKIRNRVRGLSHDFCMPFQNPLAISHSDSFLQQAFQPIMNYCHIPFPISTLKIPLGILHGFLHR